MNDLAVIMEARGWTAITADMQESVLPLIVKRVQDLNRIRSKEQFKVIMDTAAKEAAKMRIEDLSDSWLESGLAAKPDMALEGQDAA